MGDGFNPLTISLADETIMDSDNHAGQQAGHEVIGHEPIHPAYCLAAR